MVDDARRGAARGCGCIFIDAGTRDEHNLDLGARIFVRRLRALGIACEHEEFDGGHRGTAYRYEVSLPKLAAAIGAVTAHDDLRPVIPPPSTAPRSTTTARAAVGAGARAAARRGRAARRARGRPGRARLAPRPRGLGAGWTRSSRPSPDRRSPACRAFGSCGGCVLQHWDYAAQLRLEAEPRRARAGAARRAGGAAGRRLRGVAAPARLPQPLEAGGRPWRRPAWCWAPTPRARTTSSTRRAARSPSRRRTRPRRRCGPARRMPASPLRRAHADRRPAPRRAAHEPRRRACWRSGSRAARSPTARRWPAPFAPPAPRSILRM